MATQHKWKLDRKLTAMMVEDMLFDPILAAKVILGVKLPPHEELRILLMWGCYYTQDDSGFSTGKSWTFALVAALRSILIEGRVSGIISKTFAQGKLIFANLDRWYDHNAIFRSQIKHAGGKKRLVHGNEGYVAEFRGGSQIRVLPPNFLQDAERLRSERWHDAYLDEWVTYGNYQALNSTIMGRVTNINYFKNCPVRKNHVHLASTPSFQHHPAYKVVQRVDRQVARGNPDYARFTCNWRHVPNDEQWDFLITESVIFHMQTTLPKSFVETEIDGLWVKDSATWYNSKAVEACRFQNTLPVLQRTSPEQIFIGGFDVAPGGSDSRGSAGDDFAFSVFCMRYPELIPIHVLTVRFNKISDIQMSGIIHHYDHLLNLAIIVGDPGGGGLFVKDKLRQSNQLVGTEWKEFTPIITPKDPSGTIGATKLCMFERSDYYINLLWNKMAGDSVMINRLHTELKGAIENRRIVLAGTWSGWVHNEAKWDVGGKREWLNQHAHLEDKEKIPAEMDLAVEQLVLVDYEREKDGTAKLDSHGMYKFKSKEKKDSAYSLVYAYCGVLVYKWIRQEGLAEELFESTTDDKEDVIIEMEPI